MTAPVPDPTSVMGDRHPYSNSGRWPIGSRAAAAAET